MAIAIALALMAAPILAACVSCCPPAEESQSLGAPMLCCNEECGTVRIAGVRDPAIKVSCSYEPTQLAVVGVPFLLSATEAVSSEEFPAFLASSPPLRARPLLSLRI